MTQEELKARFESAKNASPSSDTTVANGPTQEELKARFEASKTQSVEDEPGFIDTIIEDISKIDPSQVAADTGNLLKSNLAKYASLGLAIPANLNEALGIDSSVFREPQEWWQKQYEEADKALIPTYGEGLYRTVAKEVGNPLNYVGGGKGVGLNAGAQTLAQLGKIVAADTAAEKAVKGDRSGVGLEDLSDVATATGATMLGGKLIDEAASGIKSLVSPNYMDMDLGTLAKKASEGNDKAKIALAQKAKADPSIIKAADELGLDLPVDAYTTGRTGEQMKDLAGMARSEVGGTAKQEFRESVADVSKRAEDIMNDIGNKDISTVSSEVLSSLKNTKTELKNSSDAIYKNISANMPKEKLEMTNTTNTINEIIDDLGGNLNSLSSKEKELFDLLIDDKITYGVLERKRREIGKTLGSLPTGEYKDADTYLMERLYSALKDDQIASVGKYMPDTVDSLKAADELVQQRKAINESIINGFGKDEAGSIVNKLRSAITSGSKGDVTNLNKVLSIVPEEQRGEALISGLKQMSNDAQGNFNFNNFNKFYGGIVGKTETRKILRQNLGPENLKKMDSLLLVSKAMQDSTNKIINTGKANQAMLDNIKNGGIIGRYLKGGVEWASRKVGIPISLDSFIKSPLSRIEDVNRLINSHEFKFVIKDIANNGKAGEKAQKMLAKNKIIQQRAKELKLSPKAFISNVLFNEEEAQPQTPAQ